MTFFKNSLFISIFLALLSCFLCFAFIDNSIGFAGDDIQIIHQAAAAVNNNVSQFINDYSFMNNHNVDVVAANAYSWGTSFLLIPVYKVFGLNNIIAFKGVMIVSYSLFVFIFSFYLARKTNIIISGLISFFLAASPFFITFSNDILKDLPYLFISFLCFIFIDSFLNAAVLKKQIFYSCMVSLILSLGVIFRENGGLLVLVLFLSQLTGLIRLILNKQKISVIIIFLYILPYITAACVYYFISLKFPTFYQSELIKCSLDSMVKTTLYYLNQIYIELFNFGKVFSPVLYLYVFMLFIYGVIKKYKYEYTAFIAVCTFIFYTACPVEQGLRYIIPLVPFIFMFAGYGVYSLKNKYLKYLSIGILIILCLFNVFTLLKMNLKDRLLYKNTNSGVISTSAIEVYDYIKNNIPEDKKIIYWHPRAVYFYTGRLSFQIGGVREKLQEADYQISITGNNRPGSFYDKEMYDFNEKTYIKEADRYLSPIYRNGNYTIYKIDKE